MSFWKQNESGTLSDHSYRFLMNLVETASVRDNPVLMNKDLKIQREGSQVLRNLRSFLGFLSTVTSTTHSYIPTNRVRALCFRLCSTRPFQISLLIICLIDLSIIFDFLLAYYFNFEKASKQGRSTNSATISQMAKVFGILPNYDFLMNHQKLDTAQEDYIIGGGNVIGEIGIVTGRRYDMTVTCETAVQESSLWDFETSYETQLLVILTPHVLIEDVMSPEGIFKGNFREKDLSEKSDDGEIEGESADEPSAPNKSKSQKCHHDPFAVTVSTSGACANERLFANVHLCSHKFGPPVKTWLPRYRCSRTRKVPTRFHLRASSQNDGSSKFRQVPEQARAFANS
ncbi:unnamed protein product [Nesidiocoris tenuis]|uniref:Uncharacterized protein n=1 Tax=Nesidiocoris tenuis TaxID=355587 RepID=A0A6H5H1G8_9HEMI|nr:unnamed protein product [Nesidiocoris tenuis]